MVTKKEIKTFYDNYKAGEYGKHSSRYEQEGRLGAILSLVDLSQARLVLDIGCGTGWLTRQYAGLTSGQVIGIDFSEESISKAGDEAEKEGLSNLKFVTMDAEKLQFEDKSFDYVICSEVLEHLLNPQKAIDEMARVVTSNGKVVITTPNPWSFNMVYGSVSRRLRKQRPLKGQIYDRPIIPPELSKMVTSAGLKIAKRKGTYYIPPLIPRLNRLYRISIRVSEFIEKVNLLPYFGLYQICLLQPNNRVSEEE